MSHEQASLEEVVSASCPGGYQLDQRGAVFSGTGKLASGVDVQVLGVKDASFVGVDEAIDLSGVVLDALKGGPRVMLVIVDSKSQKMTKRDEMLGLSQFLSHLSKTLLFADINGCKTIGVLYGHSAAGAFIATALSTRWLVAVPGAHPAVMDLPSMARVTKLSVETLEEKAKTTAVFAPGLDNLSKTGAVLSVASVADLGGRLAQLVDNNNDRVDRRDKLGEERGGRRLAVNIASAVYRAAVEGA